MAKEFFTLSEVKELFEVENGFLDLLEDEQIICPLCEGEPRQKLFPPSEVEKLRLAKLLMEDMGVNLPGVEVVLRLRQNMIEMRRQFDAILEDIARLFRQTLENMGERRP